MIKIYIVLIVLQVLHMENVHGGWPNFECPTTTNSSVYFSCNSDCIDNHGADYGECGSAVDYNCYCGPPNGKFSSLSSMCKEDTPSYQLVCDVDCQCNHGAAGGTCHLQTKVCECYGEDSQNVFCPYVTPEAFVVFIMDMLGFATNGSGRKYRKSILPADYYSSSQSDSRNPNVYIM